MSNKTRHNSWLTYLRSKGHKPETDSISHCRCSKCKRSWFTDSDDKFSPECEGTPENRFKNHFGRLPRSEEELESEIYKCP